MPRAGEGTDGEGRHAISVLEQEQGNINWPYLNFVTTFE